jgi:hypothetical protein
MDPSSYQSYLSSLDRRTLRIFHYAASLTCVVVWAWIFALFYFWRWMVVIPSFSALKEVETRGIGNLLSSWRKGDSTA